MLQSLLQIQPSNFLHWSAPYWDYGSIKPKINLWWLGLGLVSIVRVWGDGHGWTRVNYKRRILLIVLRKRESFDAVTKFSLCHKWCVFKAFIFHPTFYFCPCTTLKTVLGDKMKEKNKSQNPCIRNNVSKSSFVMDIFSFFIGDGGVLDWDTMYVGEEKIHKCAI